MWTMIIIMVVTALFVFLAYKLVSGLKDEVIEIGNLTDTNVLRKNYNTHRESFDTLIYVNIFNTHIQQDCPYEETLRIASYIESHILKRADECQLNYVARVDGKNYAIIGNSTVADVLGFCESLLESCNMRFSKYRVESLVEVYTGVYYRNKKEVNFDESALNAKKAAKYARIEKKKFCVCDYEIMSNISRVEKLEDSVERSIENNEFFAEMQPFVTAGDGKVVGCEMLSRMRGKVRDRISPATFIPAILNMELSDKFDFYVLKKCCEWLECRKGEENADKTVSCNFSRATVSEENFIPKLLEITSEFNIDYSLIAIEINENDFQTDEEQFEKNLIELKKQGFKIFWDDFGSGYTSISDLQKYPIDVAKIDKSIVANMGTEKGKIILADIIALLKKLDICVLCEGVETKEQADAVYGMGCDLVQGFYYHKPISVEAYDELLIQSENKI